MKSAKSKSPSAATRRPAVPKFSVKAGKPFTAEQAAIAVRRVFTAELREIYFSALQLAPGEAETFETPAAYARAEKLEGLRRGLDGGFRRYLKKYLVTDRRFSLEMSTFEPDEFTVHCLPVE